MEAVVVSKNAGCVLLEEPSCRQEVNVAYQGPHASLKTYHGMNIIIPGPLLSVTVKASLFNYPNKM